MLARYLTDVPAPGEKYLIEFLSFGNSYTYKKSHIIPEDNNRFTVFSDTMHKKHVQHNCKRKYVQYNEIILYNQCGTYFGNVNDNILSCLAGYPKLLKKVQDNPVQVYHAVHISNVKLSVEFLIKTTKINGVTSYYKRYDQLL